MNTIIRALIPAAVLAAMLGIILALPQKDELVEASISPDMPTGTQLAGWYGQKTQESEAERQILAADTKFSKVNYRAASLDDFSFADSTAPIIDASIVFSGQDMNASIHRPELCLPSQGFRNLTGRPARLKLSNGKELAFTRLSSERPRSEKRGDSLHFIHYYIFVGKGHIKSTHMQRVMQDMYDRLFTGRVERWAYFQIGTYWGEDIGISEAEADRSLQRLISSLLPRIIMWEDMEK